MRNAIITSIAASILLVGCGSKETVVQPVQPKPKQNTVSTTEPATTEAAPPPAPVASAAPTATPDAAPATSSSVSPTSTGAGDVLAAFRQAENGRILSDLEALQVACDVYSRKAGISEGEGIPVQPSLKGNNLSLLVKFKYLKALPIAPDGQKYVLDQKTMKVKLVK